MLPIGKEATNFVRACEAINALLADGGVLPPDDRALVEFSGRELLSKLKGDSRHFIPAIPRALTREP